MLMLLAQSPHFENCRYSRGNGSFKSDAPLEQAIITLTIRQTEQAKTPPPFYSFLGGSQGSYGLARPYSYHHLCSLQTLAKDRAIPDR